MKSIYNEFRIFSLRTIGFLFVLVFFDFTIGNFVKEIFFSQKTGKYARLTNSIYSDNSEVLIMGSSHANRHFIPEVFEKKLKLTCYNAGVQGQRIIFHTALLKMILKRHSPKLIILNIDESWMYHSKDAYERLADLHPYYWDFRNEIDSILTLNSNLISIKLLSKAYQTNSTLVHVAKYYLQPQKDYKGYRPLFKQMKKQNLLKKDIINDNIISGKTPEIDSNFVYLFKDFIRNTKTNNIDLIFVVSPNLFHSIDSKVNKSFEIMELMAYENNIPLIDFSNNKSFTRRFDLFNDPGHLNNNGAVLFSKLLVDSINNILPKEAL